jgi:hypothetical protein
MSAVEQQAVTWPPQVRGEWTVDDLVHVPVRFDPAVLLG